MNITHRIRRSVRGRTELVFRPDDFLAFGSEASVKRALKELTNIGGELEQLRVCENLSDHLTGNVYAKFCEEEDAERALNALTVRSPSTTARASRRSSPVLAGC